MAEEPCLQQETIFLLCQEVSCLKLPPAHFNNNNINMKGWLETPALTELINMLPRNVAGRRIISCHQDTS